MKKNVLGAVIFASAGLFAFSTVQDSDITGKVIPAEAVKNVWAISGADTIKSQNAGGVFNLFLKPGTYNVVIDAKEGYDDETLNKVVVSLGRSIDLGEIKLNKKRK